MSGLRERFVVAGSPAPIDAPPGPPPGSTGPPPVLGVLAAPPLTASAGAAVALAAARLARAPAALTCLWTPGAAIGAARPASLPVRGPVLPSTRRLAAALAARGHETATAGRLVLVRLVQEQPAAAAEAARVLAAAGGAAAVLALGARSEAFDGVLAGHDALVLWSDAAAPAPLAELALASLRALGPPAVALTGRLGARSRMLALAGLAAPPVARTAVGDMLASRPATVETDRLA